MLRSLSYQGQSFPVPCFEYWIWWYKHFWSIVTMWYVNCAWATAFIFNIRVIFLLKCQRFWDRKCVGLVGTRTPKLRTHAECYNHLSEIFAVPYFEYWFWRHEHFLSKVNMWNASCVRAQTFICDTRTDIIVKVTKCLKQKMSPPEGDSNPQFLDSCRMLQPFELSGPDICCPMFRILALA